MFAGSLSGSGKSYTMMGTVENKGIIPRLCDTLFERIASNEDDQVCHKVEVSYMEIYNEKVRDLLDPKGYACCSPLFKIYNIFFISVGIKGFNVQLL